MNTAVKVIENVLFILAIVIMICALACQLLQLKPLVVLSGSMEPSIMTGSLVVVDKKQTEVEEGDVISFRAGGAFVTHRVIEVEGNGYKTKGDNNEIADPSLVAKDAVEGVVAFNIPGLGYFLKVIALPVGTAVTLLYIIMKGIEKGKRYD